MNPLKLIPILSLTSGLHAWQPASDSMLTEWGEKLTADTAWQEYPRPAFERKNWTNLNGLWNYAVTPRATTTPPNDWTGEILVPFCIESALSGVKQRITPDDAIWYRRDLAVSPQPGQRTLLNFEAVDYQSTVWVNATQVGTHTGGNLPFSFDITKALKADGNTITLKVTDATDTDYQLHGKQVSEPRGIWYTPVSGIWQTVWLEQVPDTHLSSLKITPSIDGTVVVDTTIGSKDGSNPTVKILASLKGSPVGEVEGSSGSLVLKIPDPQLWSPSSPTLYDLTISVGEDSVSSYVGLRETTVVRDKHGHLRLHLNGKPLFHWGTLDQGWWPDGLLTPPSDAAMTSDIQFLKDAGFNTIRKHIKVEPRRYYTHCDQIGMLVWQDQVSTGTGSNKFKPTCPKWPRLAPNPPEAEWPDDAHEQWMRELKGMIDSLHNHPSIVQWVPFNERWGQHRTMKVGQWITTYDPSRQINIASGGNFFPVGDIVDHHQYPHPGFPFQFGAGGRFEKFVKVVGEFGGHGFPVQGHLWNPEARNWGYGGIPKDKEEWIERYRTSLRKLAELKGRGIAAGIYTQTTDVEGEINGLITYDRKVRKLDPSLLRKLAGQLLSAPDHIEIKTLLPTSERSGTEWRITTKQPAEHWTRSEFDDSSWTKAPGGFGLESTPGSHVRTPWLTNDIWLRRTFEASKDLTGNAFLRIYHDEDARVVLNGREVAALKGFSGGYIELPLPSDSLRNGTNTIAIHCKQTRGGQYIDAGIITKSGATAKTPSTAGMAPVAIPDAKVAPVAQAMSRAEIEAGLKAHDRALHIKEGWIRDPYITRGPDNFYYLTGTTINKDDPREQSDPYNIGLGDQSAVGNTVRVWKSRDLIDWTDLGTPFTLKDSIYKKAGNRIWAPEVHWIPDLNRWALVHCPKQKSNLALSAGPELKGPWSHPMGNNFAGHHDPSIFHDGKGWWILSENTNVTPLADDFSKFTGKPTRIDPSSTRPGPDGQPISRIGHEGATMMKIGGKFVHLGTAWSTDRGRQGSYNLYYCTADKITGPYGPRKFAGRFLGHGTPFQTADGNWWCTAFFNANVPPLKRDGIQTRDLSETAQTINQRGTTIVPLDVRILENGEIHIRAKDPDYANPGPDEAQKKFE